MPSIVSNVKKMCSHHGSSMAVSLGLCMPDSVKKKSIMHHSQIRLAPTPISLAATFLPVFSAHSMAFNMKETSYDFLLYIILLAGSLHVAIVAPWLSWNRNVLMDRHYPSNSASIQANMADHVRVRSGILNGPFWHNTSSNICRSRCDQYGIGSTKHVGQ